MKASTSQAFQPVCMAVLARAIAEAVANESQRRTRAGGTCRSATAPKKSGDTKAAMADVAKAKGCIRSSPCAPKTNVNGTIHAANAIHWMKNNAANSMN